MTDLDQAREHMQDIIRWWPILDDVADSLLGVTGHGVDLAGIHTAGGTSRVEVVILQLEEIQQISIDLTALAKKMGWRTIDGNPRIYIHANLAWARQNLAAAELDPIITDLHKRIARLTGHAPRPTGKTCPACGESQLRLLEDERLHCEACDIARSADEIEALTNWRITHSTLHAPLTLVAKHLGIPASTIRTWISRGHLTRNPDKTINIADTRQLAARNTP